MSGNHSRFSHQRAKRYSALNIVQGAMVTDADQMESQQITARLSQDQGRMTMRSGIPWRDGILTYDTGTKLGDPTKLKGFRPGLLVANGRAAELRLAAGQILTGNGFDIFAKQGDLLRGPALPTGAVEVAVFADVFDRHAGPAEDPRLLDAAFLAAETSVRKERVAQLKFAAIPAGQADDALKALVQDPVRMPVTGDLRLKEVTFDITAPPVDDCNPCAAAVSDAELEAGNDLFRLEIHDSPFKLPEVVAGPPPSIRPAAPADQRVTLKWSRDNGGIEIPAAARDQLLSDPTYANAVFELADLHSEQRMGLASAADPRGGQLLDRAGLAALAPAGLAGKIIRVWEGAAVIDLAVGSLQSVAVGAMGLTGTVTKTNIDWEIELRLSGLNLQLRADTRGTGAPFLLPGDAWCVEIREFATATAQRLIWEEEPVEICHDYVYVGRVASGAFVNPARPDLRSQSFPALTELAGEAVLWSNQYHPGVDANTVQDAIDLLFARDTDGCQCTFLIDPKRPLLDQLKEIDEELQGGASPIGALICFPAAEWVLEEGFAFSPVQTLVLRGCGPASRIVAGEGLEEPMLRFPHCDAVLIEDLAFENRAPRAKGVLHFLDTRQLRLNRVSVTIDGREDIDQYAVLIDNTRKGDSVFPRDVAVNDCLFNVGTSNTGLVVAGSCRLVVSGSQFQSPLKLAGSFGKQLSFAFHAIEKVLYREATLEEINASEGKLVQVENARRGIVLDVGEVDTEYRGEAVALWNKGIATLGPVGGITSLDQLDSMREAMGTVVYTTKTMSAEAMDRLSQAPDADALLNSDAADMIFLKKVSDSSGTAMREVIRTMSGNLGPSAAGPEVPLEISPRITGMLGSGRVTGRGTVFPLPTGPGGLVLGGPPTTPPAPGPTDGPPLPVPPKPGGGIVMPERKNILETVVELPWHKERKFQDIFDKIPGWFSDTGGGTFEPGALSYGIDATLTREVMTEVTGNRFSGIDVAIRINGGGQQVSWAMKDVPAPVVIRDNLILRAPRSGTIKGERDETGTHYPVTLIACGNLHVSHNTVQQIPDGSVDEKYLAALGSRKLAINDLRFAAIAITGAIGNHVHVEANSAYLFRHAVLVAVVPRAPANGDSQPKKPMLDLGRPNYWIFQHNLVTPNYEREDWRNWAVRIPGQPGLLNQVVLLRTPNHPEPPGNES